MRYLIGFFTALLWPSKRPFVVAPLETRSQDSKESKPSTTMPLSVCFLLLAWALIENARFFGLFFASQRICSVSGCLGLRCQLARTPAPVLARQAEAAVEVLVWPCLRPGRGRDGSPRRTGLPAWARPALASRAGRDCCAAAGSWLLAQHLHPVDDAVRIIDGIDFVTLHELQEAVALAHPAKGTRVGFQRANRRGRIWG